MKVHVEHSISRNTYLVYVELGEVKSGADAGKRVFLTPNNEQWIVAINSEAPVYLQVWAPAAEAIAEALRPRPEATERHLDDVIDVRDRMIALVEKTTEALLAPPVELTRAER
jgi:hypothetical protein